MGDFASANNSVIIRRYEALPERLQALERQGLSPLLARIFAHRHIDEGELQTPLEALIPPDQLLGMAAAVALLIEVLDRQGKILIVGDYDCDGATATALMVTTLRKLKAQVAYQIPHREREGYGLSRALCENIIHQNSPDLVVTVDNGIANHEGVALLRQHGIKVLITDHHLPAKTLPDAHAIINPNLPDCLFPTKHLCGAGVAFYLLIALRQALRQRGDSRDFSLGDMLDLVALATIADVVPLDRNNRLLVANGLKRIREGRACWGIRALFRVAKRKMAEATSTDLGFFIAPRINAAGRMQDMRLGIECLLATDEKRADELAEKLHRINEERRETETAIREEALRILSTLALPEQKTARTLTLIEPRWHHGVIGIVAARIKDLMHKPTFIFSRTVSGDWRGSGRSIGGVHLRDCLDYLAKKHPQMFVIFGGHSMAAGATVRDEAIKDFAGAFEQAVEALYALSSAPTIMSDGMLWQADFNLPNQQMIDRLVWGQAHPPPLFDDVFAIESAQMLGKNKRHWKIKLKNERLRASALYFNAPEHFGIAPADRFVHCTFGLIASEYQGLIEMNMRIEHWLQTSDQPINPLIGATHQGIRAT